MRLQQNLRDSPMMRRGFVRIQGDALFLQPGVETMADIARADTVEITLVKPLLQEARTLWLIKKLRRLFAPEKQPGHLLDLVPPEAGFLMRRPPAKAAEFVLSRVGIHAGGGVVVFDVGNQGLEPAEGIAQAHLALLVLDQLFMIDRKSTRLNSSH